MKTRTVEQLSDALDKELAWRKKELSAIKLLVDETNSAKSRRLAFIRAGVAMLYAHWEGFVREAGRLYLDFVSYQKLRYEQLAVNFLALAVRGLLRTAQQTDRIKAHIAVSNFFRGELTNSSNLPVKDGIRTRANLSSGVLHDIIETLGLNYSIFATKENLLDEGLLAKRNTIAHGEYLEVTVDRFNELHEQIIGLMNELRTQIDNAAVLKQYRC
jgi:MAE_28990/MAE_18760-like HEPN